MKTILASVCVVGIAVGVAGLSVFAQQGGTAKAYDLVFAEVPGTTSARSGAIVQRLGCGGEGHGCF